MIDASSTLADICFAVSTALGSHGITGVLTGGSAAAVYAPQSYMSNDVDFVLDPDEPLAKVAVVLETIGFARQGRSRIFMHVDTIYTVDFPRGPLAVGRDYVRETRVMERGHMQLRILTRFAASGFGYPISIIGKTTRHSMQPWAWRPKARGRSTLTGCMRGRKEKERSSSRAMPNSSGACISR